MSRGLVALLAGFGTGYMNREKQKRDEERQTKIDEQNKKVQDLQMQQAQAAIDKIAKEGKQDEAVTNGLQKANRMRPGEGLRTSSGGEYDNSAEAFRQRLIQQGISEQDADTAAPIYAERSQQKGAENWLSGGFNEGRVRTTNMADIVRERGAAYDEGGARYSDKAQSMYDKAEDLDVKELQAAVLAAPDIQTLSKVYDAFPDGKTLNGEVGQDGKFYTWRTDAQGNNDVPRMYDSFDQFKEHAASVISKNPDAIIQNFRNLREEQRKVKKDERDEKLSDIQIKKYQQDIEEGRLKLAALPEQIQLQIKEKKSAIAQNNAQTEKIQAEAKAGKNGTGQQPAEVKSAQWLIDQGVAKTPAEAWQMVKMTKENSPQETINGFAVRILKDNPDIAPALAAKQAKDIYKALTSTESQPPANRPPLDSFNQ